MGLPAETLKYEVQNQIVTPAEEERLRAWKALDDFLAKPNSIGLDNVKSSLRNVVTYMMELGGADNGYAYQHIHDDGHGGLFQDGARETRRKKKKKGAQINDELMRLERLLIENLSRLQSHAQSFITDIKEEIAERIAEINKKIEMSGDSVAPRLIRQKERLETLQQNVAAHEADLEKASDPVEVIQIEQELTQELAQIKTKGAKPKTASKAPSALAMIAAAMRESKEPTEAPTHKKQPEDVSATPLAKTLHAKTAAQTQAANQPRFEEYNQDSLAANSAYSAESDSSGNGESSGDTGAQNNAAPSADA